MNRTKPLFLSSFRNVRVCMSTKTRVPNHYDTLNVAKDSTQEEIKSAYYDLTKKYHPDRNTTQEAKTKFQDVSAAYEVLGNYHKRKMYDRDLLARGAAATRNTSYTVPEDKFSNFYKSRASNTNTTKSTDNFRNYDFDAWSKAHYGSTLRKQLDRKRIYRETLAYRSKLAREDEENLKITFQLTFVISTLVFFGLLLQSRYVGNFDEPVRKGSDKK